MSNYIGMERVPVEHSTTYTITAMGRCRVVYGTFPLADFDMLLHGFSDAAKMDLALAERIGASLVIGEPEDLKALRLQPLPLSQRRQDYAEAARTRGLPLLAQWFEQGDVGMSALALCHHLFCLPEEPHSSHPLDPDDLNRCLKFLRAVSAEDRLPEMACVSDDWRRLVAIWPTLVSTFDREQTAGRSASETYALMQSAQ